jgi:uncharacterized sulfatase
MKHTRTLLAALLLAPLPALTTAAAKERPKNVLILLSDDQGYCELGSFMDFATSENLGSEHAQKYRNIKTTTEKQATIEVCFEAARKSMPNIDALAKRGVRFTNFHAAPTCSPSRAALMTGRYPQGFGVYSNGDVEGRGESGIPPAVNFPVKLFQEAGFATGMIGKWHLGSKTGQSPNDRGFNYFFGFDRAHTEKYDSKILQRNGEKTPAVGWLADQISDEAVAFLDRSDTEKKPFFLYVAYNEPHGPTSKPPQTYIDHFKSGSELVDIHFATIYGMDQGIGRILEELKRTGRLEDTLILFGSDNGLAQGSYHKGFSAKPGSYLVPVPGNGPLRGCKWTPWEGAVRVPFIASLPNGTVKTTQALTSIMDVIPTVLDFAGIKAPKTYQIDGESFLPILQGKSDGDAKRLLFWASDADAPFGDFGPDYDRLETELAAHKEIGTDRSNRLPPAWFALTPQWKLMGWDTIDPVLIDLTKDVGERNNVTAGHPDVVKALRAKFDGWISGQATPKNFSKEQWRKLFTTADKKTGD